MPELKFKSTTDLRNALKRYLELKITGEIDAAVMLFDLDQGLGVLTARQHQAIRLHLIESMPVACAARTMGIEPRVVYLIVNAGLRRLLRFLQTGERPRVNRYHEWTEPEIRSLIRLSHLPRKELATRLKRSVSSIQQKLSELRVHGLLIATRKTGRVVPKADGVEGKAPRVSGSDGCST